jgi:hypothetical protein
MSLDWEHDMGVALKGDHAPRVGSRFFRPLVLLASVVVSLTMWAGIFVAARAAFRLAGL